MRGNGIAAAVIVGLGVCAGPAAADDVVAGGLAFRVDPRAWRAEGDRLVCTAEACRGAVVRVRRSAAACDDALLIATAQEEIGRSADAVRVLPARDLFVRLLVVPSPCRSWSADPIFACVTVGGATRLITTSDDRGRICGVPGSANARLLDLLGGVGEP